MPTELYLVSTEVSHVEERSINATVLKQFLRQVPAGCTVGRGSAFVRID